MAKLNVSPPWYTYYHGVEELFRDDPEIRVLFDDGSKKELRLYVETEDKANALALLLPEEKVFGTVALNIKIIPANGITISSEEMTMADAFKALAKNNPVFAFVKVIEGSFFHGVTYVVFRNQVVQYYNDELSDLYGLRSTLYQDIAKETFEDVSGVFFCTDVKTNFTNLALGAPLGEWP